MGSADPCLGFPDSWDGWYPRVRDRLVDRSRPSLGFAWPETPVNIEALAPCRYAKFCRLWPEKGLGRRLGHPTDAHLRISCGGLGICVGGVRKEKRTPDDAHDPPRLGSGSHGAPRTPADGHDAARSSALGAHVDASRCSRKRSWRGDGPQAIDLVRVFRIFRA